MCFILLQPQRSGESEAPSTALRSLRELRAVPLPRCAGADARVGAWIAHAERNNNLGFRVGRTLSVRAGAITVAPGVH